MKMKNLIFDLDGVLFDGVQLHKKAFLDAVRKVVGAAEKNPITEVYHDTVLNGLSTKQKLSRLVQEGFIRPEQADSIEKEKKESTRQLIQDSSFFGKNTGVKVILETLKLRGFALFCVSNSIRETVVSILEKLGCLDLFTGLVSNEDVSTQKPSPGHYTFTFEIYSLKKEECLIFEDSHHGRTSAYLSGAPVCRIVDPLDLTLEKIEHEIAQVQATHPIVPINIVIPMAGHGSRFASVGFKQPKPFIPVFSKPMIQWVIENAMPKPEEYNPHPTIPSNIKPTFHFIAQEAHLKEYDLGAICQSLNIEYTITTVPKVTEGPACTVLLAKEYINNEIPLITFNSDQFIDWDVNEFYRALLNPVYDGCINTFYQPNEKDIKWSYAKTDERGLVTEVAEKKYISLLATTGIYGWKRGSDFVKYAEQMIEENVRVNNEFYVCPVYMYLIRAGGKIRTYDCKKLWGLGVPEDLDYFVKNYTYSSSG
jgi:beta-phosphoglucomutase-like phosphatase (HAD superfamily)/dTDP-glucose pyrophosphorylase